jgi:hypothetical protein
MHRRDRAGRFGAVGLVAGHRIGLVGEGRSSLVRSDAHHVLRLLALWSVGRTRESRPAERLIHRLAMAAQIAAGSL